jgi:hypothetical protein
MKKKYTAIAVAALQLILIAAYIHSNSVYVRMSFEKQRLEKQRIVLQERKQSLTHAVAALHNPNDVKQFAQEQLHMQPIALSNIKTLTTTYA